MMTIVMRQGRRLRTVSSEGDLFTLTGVTPPEFAEARRAEEYWVVDTSDLRKARAAAEAWPLREVEGARILEHFHDGTCYARRK